MSWFAETNTLSFVQKLGINVIKCGAVPRHVAIIMDGNRRYARQKHMVTADGHREGFARLADALMWCRELDVKEVTVYAFSLENFKRDAVEVRALMELAAEKFEKLLSERDKLDEYGVRIRIIGKWSHLPDNLRRLMCQAVHVTRHNSARYLNVAFAYISQDEIATSISTIVNGVNDKQLAIEDISERVVNDCLYTNECSPPDILIRTSGETRYSNFLLWQISFCLVIFTNILWPNFTLWHLLVAIFFYQRKRHHVDVDTAAKRKVCDVDASLNENQRQFIAHISHVRRKEVENWAQGDQI